MDLDGALITGVSTAVAAAFGWLVRGRNKQLDVATTWQTQMIERVTALEADLKLERRRTDDLERKNDQLAEDRAKWRGEAQHLKWQYEAMLEALNKAEQNVVVSRERIAALETECRLLQGDATRLNEQLTQERTRAVRLQTEQRHLRSEIHSGLQSMRPSMATPTPPPPVVIEDREREKEG